MLIQIMKIQKSDEKHAKRFKFGGLPLQIIIETVKLVNEENLITHLPKTCKLLSMAATFVLKLLNFPSSP